MVAYTQATTNEGDTSNFTRVPFYHFNTFLNRLPFTWPAFALDYRHPPSSIWRALASVNIDFN